MLGRNKGQTDQERKDMARVVADNDEGAISIIASGMTIVGDCETGGTVRIEGRVEGTVRAGKSVVVGRGGEVMGDVLTQDAVISGRVCGNIVAESRLELQATSDVEGEIRSRRVKLDEGARFNGELHIEDSPQTGQGGPKPPRPAAATAGGDGGGGAGEDGGSAVRTSAAD